MERVSYLASGVSGAFTGLASGTGAYLANVVIAKASSHLSSENTPLLQLNYLLTEAIANPGATTFEALSRFSESGEEQEWLGDLLGSIHESDIPGSVPKLIKAQQELAREIPSSALASKVQKFTKGSFCAANKSLLGALESKLPPDVYAAVYQILSQYQIDDAKQLKQAAEEILQAFENIEFRIQGWNFLGFVQQVFKTLQAEPEPAMDVDATQEFFYDATDDQPALPALTPAERQKAIQHQKQELIENTQLFLSFKLACDACLTKEELFSQGDDFYMRWLVTARGQNEVTPEAYLKGILMGSIGGGGFTKTLRTIKASIVWWFISLAIPSLITNLFNHTFDAFYNGYISSGSEDKCNKKLFDHIIVHLDRYLSVLKGAYDRVAATTKVSDNLDGLLAQELEDPCTYANMTRTALYKEVLHYMLQAALGGSITARVTSFAITTLFSWRLVPAVMGLVDRRVVSLLHSNGYPHGINLILSKQLANLKKNLEKPPSDQQIQVASIPLSDKKRLKGSIEQLLYTLSCNAASSLQTLKPPSGIESMVFNKAAESLTTVAARVIQDLSRDRQIEQLFLELMQDVNKAYKIPSAQPSKAAEKEVDQGVKALTQEVLHLYVKRFIEDLDLSGKNKQDLFIQLLKGTKRQISSFIQDTTAQFTRLKFEEINVENIAKQVNSIQEKVQKLNELLNDLSFYSLLAEHKGKLTTINQDIITRQTQLLKHLEKMQGVVAESIQSRDLGLINVVLADLKQDLDTDKPIIHSGLRGLKTRLDGYKVTVPPGKWAALETACAEFEKNRQEKETISAILSTFARDNTDGALTFLEAQSNIWQKREFQQARATLAASPVKGNLEIVSTWGHIRSKFMPAPVTEEAQAIVLDKIKDDLQKQLDKRKDAMQATKGKQLIAEIQLKIREQQATLVENPGELFEEAKDGMQEALTDLRNYQKASLKIPNLYNVEVLPNEKITNIVLTLIKLPGIAERYLESMTSFLSKKETYSCGLFPHLVLLPIIGKGKSL